MTDDVIDVEFPHCDLAVLHAPGECKYCDQWPNLQQVRQWWGIAFTGHTPENHQLPCPSDYRRGRAGAHVWVGNRPVPELPRPTRRRLPWRRHQS